MRLIQPRPGVVIAHAPAKLNLFLEVLSKRDDGYHELETLMVAVDLFDTLVFKEDRSREIALEGDGLDEHSSQQNLVARAARLLAERTRVQRGVRIRLVKCIPAAAGLGGGSSDAAATLVALERLWDLRLERATLVRWAAELGSDVPFFLHGSAAVCRGRGDIVEPVSLPFGLHFVVASPPEPLSTAAVFQACAPPPKSEQRSVPGFVRTALRHLPDPLKPVTTSLRAADRWPFNRLQSVAERLEPAVARLRNAFEQLPVVGHQMTGSGSSYFGLCVHRRHALHVAARLRARLHCSGGSGTGVSPVSRRAPQVFVVRSCP